MRPLLLLTALALAALPCAAAAQGQTCYAMQGGRLFCTESFSSLADRLDRQTEGRRPKAQPAAAEGAAEASAPPDPGVLTPPMISPAQSRLVAAVAKAILAGRCAKAEDLALKAGDLALADEAAKRCVPAGAKADGAS